MTWVWIIAAGTAGWIAVNAVLGIVHGAYKAISDWWHWKKEARR